MAMELWLWQPLAMAAPGYAPFRFDRTPGCDGHTDRRLYNS